MCSYEDDHTYTVEWVTYDGVNKASDKKVDLFVVVMSEEYEGERSFILQSSARKKKEV